MYFVSDFWLLILKKEIQKDWERKNYSKELNFMFKINHMEMKYSILSFSLNMSDRTRIDCNSELVVKIFFTSFELLEDFQSWLMLQKTWNIWLFFWTCPQFSPVQQPVHFLLAQISKVSASCTTKGCVALQIVLVNVCLHSLLSW